MHLLRRFACAALNALALAGDSLASSSQELVARQIPAPQINVYCITHETTAPAGDFNTTFHDTCNNLYTNDVQLPVGEQVTHETCFDDYCITTLLVYKCGKPGTSSSIDYDSCRTLFGLPWNRNGCASGGYVGSSAPGACWTALSIATPKSSNDRLPAVPKQAWSNGAFQRKRQAPGSGVTACVQSDWLYGVSYDQVFQDAADFCYNMEQDGITLATGESYWSDNKYCDDATCLNFYVDWYCVAPGGGPAYANVTYEGCLRFVLFPWWGPDFISEQGYCSPSQGEWVKGGWVTERDPAPCWNFTTLVTAPLSVRNALPGPDDFTLHQNEVAPPPPTATSNLLRRQADQAGVACSPETFEGIFFAFCQLYEYCPFLNDESFNLTQSYEILGQNVTLSVAHTGACIKSDKPGPNACVAALNEALDNVCQGEDTGGDEGVEVDKCWEFSIDVE